MAARATKAPPYSILAEKLALGGMLRDPTLIGAIHGIVGDAEVFFRAEHGALYAALLAVTETPNPPGDTEAILTRLAEAGHAADQAEVAALRRLAADGPGAEATREHARIVVDKWNRRRLIEVATSVIHDAYYREDRFGVIYEEACARLAAIGERPAGHEHA